VTYSKFLSWLCAALDVQPPAGLSARNSAALARANKGGIVQGIGGTKGLAIALVIALSAFACLRENAEPAVGTVVLPSTGIAWEGSQYRLQGSYTLTSLDSERVYTLPIAASEVGALRQQVPAGRYRISLDPGFTLSWQNREPPGDERDLIHRVERPDVVVVTAGRVAEVHLHTEPLAEERLAQR
jgi:hypothetical protein